MRRFKIVISGELVKRDSENEIESDDKGRDCGRE